MAAEQHGSVLDGDPLQAVWFNWIHPERGHLRWADALDFFRQRAHCLLVPAGYVHLHIDEATRYKREQVRETIRGHSADQFRDKWARYAQFTAPQTALFSAMQHTYPNWVVSIQAAEIESTVDKILNLRWADPPAAADLMDWLQYWLNHHHAAEFQ